jgi:hypothetical protein
VSFIVLRPYFIIVGWANDTYRFQQITEHDCKYRKGPVEITHPKFWSCLILHMPTMPDCTREISTRESAQNAESDQSTPSLVLTGTSVGCQEKSIEGLMVGCCAWICAGANNRVAAQTAAILAFTGREGLPPCLHAASECVTRGRAVPELPIAVMASYARAIFPFLNFSRSKRFACNFLDQIRKLRLAE